MDANKYDPTRLTDPRRLAALEETALMDGPTEIVYDRLTRLAQRLLGVPVVLFSVVDDKRQFFKSATGLSEPYATTRQTPLSHSFCKYVVMSGEPLVVEDATLDPMLRDNLAVSDLNVTSYMGVPLTTLEGDVLGSFCAIDSIPHEWTPEQQEILQDFARFTMTEVTLRRALHVAQETTRRLREAQDREARFGAAIQETLLLRKPPRFVEGVTFGAVYRPSQRIGGDYSEFLVYDNGCVDVLVGDVMGKGVPAALMSAAAKSHFQRAVRRLGLDYAPLGRLPEPEEIVSAVHATLTPELIRLGSFVTLSYARFDITRQTLTLVDCGHPRVLHWREGEGCCTPLSGPNVPLGVLPDEQYQQVTVPFARGDRFLLYTDGLSEATGEGDELFGETRLMDLLARGADASAEDLARSVEQETARFRGANDNDDVTCVVVRIESEGKNPFRAYRSLELHSRNADLDAARDFVEEFCRAHCAGDLSEDERGLLALGVHEALTNVIRHAYGDGVEGRIQLEARVDQDALQFRLRDTGRAFPPASDIATPSFDGSRDSGFGLFIVESVMDGVERTRDDMGRNTLTLTRNLRNVAQRSPGKDD